jgi:hypothetical protein
MRYMMLVTAPADPGPVPPALIEARNKWVANETEAGSFIDGAEFIREKSPKSICLQEGIVEMTDGPFAEAKEVLGGYMLFEFPTHNAAEMSAHAFLELHVDHWPGWDGAVTLLPITAVQTHNAQPKP